MSEGRVQQDERVLDHMVCFSLYSANRATTRAYRQLLKPWGLTYPQYLVLVLLWASGPHTVRELGERLQLDSGTLSPLLRRLETAGHITKAREAADGRVVTVALTERGTALRDDMAQVPAQLAACMQLTIASAQLLLGTLHTLTDHLHSQVESHEEGH